MKRFIFLTVAVMTMFLTTGCIKCSYNFEIDKKGNVTIAEVNAINSQMFKAFNADESSLNKQFDTAKKDLEKEGYKVENYNEGNFIGLKRSKNYSATSFNMTKLPAGFSAKSLNPFEIKESFLKNTLNIKLSYNYKKAQENMEKEGNTDNTDDSSFNETSNDPNIISTNKTVDEETGEVTEITEYRDGSTATTRYNQNTMNNFGNALSSMFEANPEMKPSAELVIKIPYKSTENNATKVLSDNEYQWDLTLQENVDIVLKAEKINWNNILGALFVIVAVIAGLLIWNKYKETTSW
ncbi:MAG: hypothetical protein MJ231_03930 [bacterium]|nr:hypothetical protein [bacterium]